MKHLRTSWLWRNKLEFILVAAGVTVSAIVLVLTLITTTRSHASAGVPAHPPHASSAPSTPSGPQFDSCPPQVDACVDTRLRVSWLQKNGHVIYGPVPVMPGTVTPSAPDDNATPQGVFRVQWKAAKYTSEDFNEPMPYAVFFAPGGVAFHEGSLGASSHGCVHLGWDAARQYFDHLPVGAQVAVFGGQPPPS